MIGIKREAAARSHTRRMNPKTVLVCLDNEANVERLVRFAAGNAAGAALVGTRPVPPGPAVDAFGAVGVESEATERIRTRFEAVARDAGCEPTWSALPRTAKRDAALCDEARTCDIVVMPQPGNDAEGAVPAGTFRALVVGAGRPVLMLPRAGDFGEVGRRVLIGWCPTREAARAVHDALALAIRPNSRVTLLRVSQGERPELERSAAALCALLERHGVRTEAASWPRTELVIGDVILSQSAEMGADLIVTGACGHSRLYDLTIGATTTHLLERMTVPVLFSH